jgi:hypothetical protein
MRPNLVTVFRRALDRSMHDDVKSLPAFLSIIGSAYFERIFTYGFHSVEIRPLP